MLFLILSSRDLIDNSTLLVTHLWLAMCAWNVSVFTDSLIVEGRELEGK